MKRILGFTRGGPGAELANAAPSRVFRWTLGHHGGGGGAVRDAPKGARPPAMTLRGALRSLRGRLRF